VLNLPEGPARDKARSQIEDDLRRQAYKLADGLVAKMDSVRFLRFFGVRPSGLFTTLRVVLTSSFAGSHQQPPRPSLPPRHRDLHVGVRALQGGRSARCDERTEHAHPPLSQIAHRPSFLLPLWMTKLIMPFCRTTSLSPGSSSASVFLSLTSSPVRPFSSPSPFQSDPIPPKGENLNMPVVGPALQKCGAFFIRRTFGDDPLYSTVVKEYIEDLLENGKNSAVTFFSIPPKCRKLTRSPFLRSRVLHRRIPQSHGQASSPETWHLEVRPRSSRKWSDEGRLDLPHLPSIRPSYRDGKLRQ
jgi:hypothetical protein